ncbi:hypothetical protein C8Q80DRAFT_1269409 [Daedaleopsis nitida]|nr:hypothetical protein C8Q80DRAFT_1269409 [Daedaleopsis nitida]
MANTSSSNISQDPLGSIAPPDLSMMLDLAKLSPPRDTEEMEFERLDKGKQPELPYTLLSGTLNTWVVVVTPSTHFRVVVNRTTTPTPPASPAMEVPASPSMLVDSISNFLDGLAAHSPTLPPPLTEKPKPTPCTPTRTTSRTLRGQTSAAMAKTKATIPKQPSTKTPSRKKTDMVLNCMSAVIAKAVEEAVSVHMSGVVGPSLGPTPTLRRTYCHFFPDTLPDAFTEVSTDALPDVSTDASPEVSADASHASILSVTHVTDVLPAIYTLFDGVRRFSAMLDGPMLARGRISVLKAVQAAHEDLVKNVSERFKHAHARIRDVEVSVSSSETRILGLDQGTSQTKIRINDLLQQVGSIRNALHGPPTNTALLPQHHFPALNISNATATSPLQWDMLNAGELNGQSLPPPPSYQLPPASSSVGAISMSYSSSHPAQLHAPGPAPVAVHTTPTMAASSRLPQHPVPVPHYITSGIPQSAANSTNPSVQLSSLPNNRVSTSGFQGGRGGGPRFLQHSQQEQNSTVVLGKVKWNLNSTRQNFFDVMNPIFNRNYKKRHTVQNVAVDLNSPLYARVKFKRRSDAEWFLSSLVAWSRAGTDLEFVTARFADVYQ